MTPNLSTLLIKPGSKQNRRMVRIRRLSFLSAILALGLAILTSLLNTTSANFSKKDWSNTQPDSALQLMRPNPAGQARLSEIAVRDDSLLRKLTAPVDLPSGRFYNLLLPQGPAGPEMVDTFAEDCTTPKTDFNFGETVCVVVSNAPLGANERLVWGHTDGFLARETTITAVTQNDSLFSRQLRPSVVSPSTTVVRG